MNEMIKRDLFRVIPRKASLVSFLQGLRIPGFRYLFVFRKLSEAKRYSPIWVVYKVLLRHYMYKFGFQIPTTCKIGAGLYLGHFGTIIIHPETKIGMNCNIAQGVTIGRIAYGRNKGVPIIGDFVWIGANSVLVGGVTIGTNVLIAPGAYVNFNVPSNSIVLGNPGEIKHKENPKEGYINNILE